MKEMLALVAAALVAACGGSSDEGPSTPYPDGNDSKGTATQMSPGTPVAASIAVSADYDFYRFTVPDGGAVVNFQTFDGGGTSCDLVNDSVDTFVEVYQELDVDPYASSDDSGINLCEDFNVTLPAGTNYVVVSAYPWVPFPMTYTLKVTIL